ncbi:hypothetical protein [Nocardia huaxiensis]|uniref:Uncharacterized protein n=1 Tax=Nocardia huaxiensis TaxID=2755382 RepID=A0A7D6Z0R7_9NOCA|nr:hypothetical protein [Nocardia huaxiensis]QLY27584.1 hypothetical protein H0264_19075 [Nocardia huaxiensis]UFS99037.1 hypothetical protein LPY97_14625 [Nocardia huaxiensis]
MSTPAILLAPALAAGAFGLGVWLGVRCGAEEPPPAPERIGPERSPRRRPGSWWHPVRAR